MSDTYLEIPPYEVSGKATIWIMIRRYVEACGGDPERPPQAVARQIRDVEQAIDLLRADDAEVLCTGGEW